MLFLQAVLDARFLTLVQDPKALEHLTQLQSLIAPETLWNKDVVRVRCVLEPFVRAERARAKGPKIQAKDDGRTWKKKSGRPPALHIGLYQVEETRI